MKESEQARFRRLPLEIGSAKPGRYFFTSNVDGQFQRAGFAAERMVECRGAIHHLQCTAPCADLIWDAESETVNIEESTFRALEPLPQCRNCPALARPNILMFRGPVMWLGHRTDAQQQRFAGWLDGLVKSSAKPRSGEQCRLTHGFGFGLRFNGHVLLYVGEGGLRLKGQIPCPS